MIEEKELIELMTKSGEAYFSGKVEEGNRYAEELIHKLDFNETRDQNVLVQIIGNALVRNDEIVVLDYLKDAGFDFNMTFTNGKSLIDFFRKYPKFNEDSRVYQKLEAFGVSADIVGNVNDNKLKQFFRDNENVYNLWWDRDKDFYDYECRVATQEQNDIVMENVRELVGKTGNTEAAKGAGKLNLTSDDYGMTVLHYGVWHNYYDMVDELIKSGADVNVQVEQKNSGRYYAGIAGATPLHIACYMGNYKMAKRLVEAGADMSITDDSGRTVLHYLASLEIENCRQNSMAQRESVSQRRDIAKLVKCDVNAQDKNGNTALITLLDNEWGMISKVLVQELIDMGADINVCDKENNTTLIKAAAHSEISACFVLIKNRELINRQNKDGDTALHIAVREDHFEIAYVLLDMGADTEIANHEGKTARDIINDGWNERLQSRLMKKRGDSVEDIIKMVHETLFHSESIEDDSTEFILYFIQKILRDIDEDDDDEIGYIYKILDLSNNEDYAAKIVESVQRAGFDFVTNHAYNSNIVNIRDFSLKPHKGIKTIKKMADLGIDLDSAYIKGRTPANIVAGIPEFPKPLFEKNYVDYGKCAEYFSVDSMTELSEEGTTAMHLAARNNHVVMLQTMIEKGADVNVIEDAPGIIGATPLHQACIKGNVEIVKILKEAGADDSLTTQEGETCAHYIARKVEPFRNIDGEKRAAIMEMLDHVDTQRNDGKTPLLLVQLLDYNATTELTMTLLDKNVDVNKADNAGNTALLLHIDEHCNKDVVKELIRAGADVNVKNRNGDTPLHLALRRGNDMVGRFLIKKGADYNVANNSGETPVDIAVSKGMEVVLELMEL